MIIRPYYWWIPGEYSDDLAGFCQFDDWTSYMQGHEGPFARWLLEPGVILTAEGRRIRQMEDGMARANRLRRRKEIEDVPPICNLKHMDIRLMKKLFPITWPLPAQPKGLI